MLNITLEQAKTAEVNGVSLAYVEQGEGEAVVFVHGAMSDLRTWQQQLPEIGRSLPSDHVQPALRTPERRHRAGRRRRRCFRTSTTSSPS